jgi:phosphoribosylglycinamide formyltransferase-1
MNVAVMASGSGTNLQALLDSESAGTLGAQIRLVISNRSGAGALERARRHGREALHLSPSQFPSAAAYAQRLQEELAQRAIDLVCLAGYLKKLPETVVKAYDGRVLNIHPAPLPRFGGAGMYGEHVHRAVLAAGVSHSGPTVHFVDPEYDTGPIVAHIPVPVRPGDTPETLASRVLSAEHRLYPLVVAAVARGRVRLVDGRVLGRVDVS